MTKHQCTKKNYARSAVRIKLGVEEKLFLGNLDSKRDWGHTNLYGECGLFYNKNKRRFSLLQQALQQLSETFAI